MVDSDKPLLHRRYKALLTQGVLDTTDSGRARQLLNRESSLVFRVSTVGMILMGIRADFIVLMQFLTDFRVWVCLWIASRWVGLWVCTELVIVKLPKYTPS